MGRGAHTLCARSPWRVRRRRRRRPSRRSSRGGGISRGIGRP